MCGRCHNCGQYISTVLDGEEWCSGCRRYQRPKSHGWTVGENTPCPKLGD